MDMIWTLECPWDSILISFVKTGSEPSLISNKGSTDNIKFSSRVSTLLEYNPSGLYVSVNNRNLKRLSDV